MKAQRSLYLLLLAVVWLLAGCVSVDGTPFAELTVPAAPAESTIPESASPQSASPASTPSSGASSGSGSFAEFALQPMAEGEALSEAEIFEMLSPALAHIETPLGTGSAVLLEQDYLLTNARAVWPYRAVSATFPDGTEVVDVEVVGWDLIADLALLRLPEGAALQATPLSLVDASQLAAGSELYLLGYPGEVEDPPQPVISQGTLSRIRTWETTGMEIFQVNASDAGELRGGILVTERGEVAGVIAFESPSTRLVMVPSAASVVPRLNALANDPNAAFADRRPLGGETATEYRGQLENSLDSDLYILDVEAGEEIEIAVQGIGAPRVFVATANYGLEFLESEPLARNIHSLDFTTTRDAGPYLIYVSQASDYRNSYTLFSSHPLAAYEDSDDHMELAPGEVYTGALDLPGDVDRFALALEAGEKIAVEVDSLMVRPLVSLLYESPTRLELVQSRDGGAANLFGENARLVFEAPEDATYLVTVASAANGEVGGYFLMVTEADAGEEPTEPVESRSYILSPFGRLALYESERHDFSIQHPGEWQEREQCPPGVVACFSGGAEAGLHILEEDLELLGLDDSQMTQEGYSDLIEEILRDTLQDSELVLREEVTTPQGLIGTKLVFSADDGEVILSRFIYVNEDNIAFNATYFASASVYAALEEFFDYSYQSFREWDTASRDFDPVWHLDEGQRLAGEQEYEAAIEALTEAIELEPELVEAYAARASVYASTGDYELAIADYEAAVELDPENVGYVGQIALTYWYMGDLEMALEYADQVVERDPENAGFFNNRALIRTSAGDYEGALEDMEQVVELVGGEDALSPGYIDTRAYVYLKMGDYEAAKRDYDRALARDFKSAYTLLGGGLAYAALGMMDRATEMFEYGMELYREEPEDYPDPQLADLLEMAAEYINMDVESE